MYVLLGVLGVVVLAAVVYGLVSRRQSLPCPVWLGWLVEMDNPLARTNRAAAIVAHSALGSGMTVLDAGCGPGRVTIPAARAVGTTGCVVALDLQPGMLERVREKAGAAGLESIEYVQAGLGEGRLDSGRFDRVLLVTVLGEIPDPAAALAEIYEALKPGGLLSVTELVFDPHFQRRGAVTRLAMDAGFREQAFYGNRFAYTLVLEKADGD